MRKQLQEFQIKISWTRGMFSWLGRIVKLPFEAIAELFSAMTDLLRSIKKTLF